MDKEQKSLEAQEAATNPLRKSGRIVASRYMQSAKTRTGTNNPTEKSSQSDRSGVVSGQNRTSHSSLSSSVTKKTSIEKRPSSMFKQSSELVSKSGAGVADIQTYKSTARSSSSTLRVSKLTQRPSATTINRKTSTHSIERKVTDESTRQKASLQNVSQIQRQSIGDNHQADQENELEYILWALIAINSEVLYKDEIKKMQQKLEYSKQELCSEYETQQETNVKLDCLEKMLGASDWLLHNQTLLEAINKSLGLISEDYEKIGKILQQSASILPISNICIYDQGMN
ncbi:hypothetical protein BB561_004079 [Smittium simulii]|uniref:Uncharacterized protein n=1 Tax=Smittium simulii TaxID=133385 RepID=A0A2T9YI57_9FUNG|nr:hypothetical protein BB561_004079 [Smittium simulii]